MPLPRTWTRAILAFITAAVVLPGCARAESVLKAEAEQYSGAGTNGTDANASAGEVRHLYANGTVSFNVPGAVLWLGVRMRATSCNGDPRVRITLDGKSLGDTVVTGDGRHRVYPITLTPTANTTSHTISLSFLNDYRTSSSCDRNVALDYSWVTTEPPALPTITRLYVDPTSPALDQADLWRTSRPADAALMTKLGQRSVATWVGGWSGDERVLTAAVAGAKAAKARLVLVVYGIPLRDAGGYSAGGHDSSADYRAWIDWMIGVIGSTPTLTIVEPDAAAMDVAASVRSERDSLLRYATARLNSLADNMVYVDAGNSGWRTPSDMASRLVSAGVGAADGFALNVSNFLTTSSQIDYGYAIRRQLGTDAHIVLDTGRNGNGPLPGATGESAWCNPPGRAVGSQPTLATGAPNVDAFVWAKRPGSSDGACRGFPAAGTWMPETALDLIRGASW
jgi:endoglucanase